MKTGRVCFFGFLLSLLFASCSKDIEQVSEDFHYKIYTIKKGNHSSGVHANTFSRTHLEFTAIFNESAIYKISDQSDVNKLYGFSDCNCVHMENSARFGWRWNDSLEIFGYTHNDGIIDQKYIASIPVNKECRYHLFIDNDYYYFTVNGNQVKMKRSCTNKGGTKYYLFPYFGGDEKAPHEITIKIKEF